MTESQQRLHAVQQAVGVVRLSGHSGRIGGSVHRQIDILRVGGGEAVVGRVVPLHRRAGARAEVAALLGGQRQIAHTDLVTVVDEGCTGQRENCRVGQPQLVSRQARGGADRVMVAGDEAPQTVLVGGLVGRQVIVQEFAN